MKNLVIILASVIFASCSMAPSEPEIPTFEAVYQIKPWIKKNITYVADPIGGAWDMWQTPEETLGLRTADCEDFSILWLFLVYETIGEKGELVISRDVEDGELHVSARLGELTYYTINQEELFTIAYDDAMATAQAKRLEGGTK